MRTDTGYENIRSALRTAFWSGGISVKKWRRAIRARSLSHKALVKTSFMHMPSVLLVREIGRKEFIKRWPELRKLFNPRNNSERKRLLLFDSIWGLLTAGDSQYPVSEQIARLSKGRRQILREIVNHPGITIYALSEKVNRQYSRVFKEVKMLAALNLVDIKEDRHQGRKISKLTSPHSINTELAAAI